MTDVQALWQDRVTQLESRSGAEIVVAVQPQAGSYIDIHWKWAALAMTVSLLFMVHGPLLFHADGVLLNALFAGLMGYLASWRVAPLRRLLTTVRRRQNQMEYSCREVFERLQISHTRDRVGLLLLVSRFENRAILRPDVGLSGRIPGALLHRLQSQLDSACTRSQLDAAVTRVLEELREPLQDSVPLGSDDANELSNQVRNLC